MSITEAAIERASRNQLAQHLDAMAAQADVAAAHHAQLRDAFTAAFVADPATVIPTPGWTAESSAPVIDVVSDAFAARDDTTLAGLMRLAAACADGQFGPAAALRAGSLIADMAARYADFHIDPLLMQMEGEL